MRQPQTPPERRQRPRRFELRSDDGSVRFVILAIKRGIHVERFRLKGRRRLTFVHSVLFADGGSFRRWCEADATRFEFPMLHAKLKATGSDLLAHEPPT